MKNSLAVLGIAAVAAVLTPATAQAGGDYTVTTSTTRYCAPAPVVVVARPVRVYRPVVVVRPCVPACRPVRVVTVRPPRPVVVIR